MAGLTLAQAEARLQQYLDAEAAVLGGQAYEIEGRMLRRADLTAIQEGIKTWDARCKELEQSSRRRSRAVVMVPSR